MENTIAKKSGKLASAHWTSMHAGVVELSGDWRGPSPPPLYHTPGRQPLTGLHRVDLLKFAEKSGYFVDKGWITFLLSPERYPELDLPALKIYVGGDFNQWGDAIGKSVWEMALKEIEGKSYCMLNIMRGECLGDHPVRFKFVTQNGQWLEIPSAAPNGVQDHHGIRNYELHPGKTGRHLFSFTIPDRESLEGGVSLLWIEDGYEEVMPIAQGEYFLQLESGLPLGAILQGGETVFRLFAPRARSASVRIYRNGRNSEAENFKLRKEGTAVWEGRYPENLEGCFYFFRVEGLPEEPLFRSDPVQNILDPYALAAAGPGGPGIILDPSKFKRPTGAFTPPAREDLVILEGHLRDLLKDAPIDLEDRERLGFAGLRKWVEEEGNYLSQLGVNAVELQPIQEFDAGTAEAYHWGYMPVNFFSPSSCYARDPTAASQISEFQDLVAAFHNRGIAVIMDVVYNHCGDPNHLERIDKYYYFKLDQNGEHLNWSGCGNTLRCATPMAQRLIGESLIHFLEVYDIDGFRFDLAEILGLEVLREIESRLRKVKPSVVLIAEPWSFHGHLGPALKTTGYSSWNDGFRDFLRDYILGKGDAKGMRYYLSGSPDYLTARPAQSINYVESHDDHCWIDRITENNNYNGYFPTATDRRRTHLMLALLMASLGVPMLSAGQDMLRSKRGVRNTYLRGDLNGVDYERAVLYSGTHEYFKRWIRFRLSEKGRLLRLGEQPGPGFFRFFHGPDSSGMAALYNADRVIPKERLFFAVNPHLELVEINLSDFDLVGFRQIADHERFEESGLESALLPVRNNRLILPELSCGLWVESD